VYLVNQLDKVKKLRLGPHPFRGKKKPRKEKLGGNCKSRGGEEKFHEYLAVWGMVKAVGQ